jgi:hypothetical protein
VVNWAREFSVVSVKYRLYAGAANWLTGTPSAPSQAANLGLAAAPAS